MLALQSLEELYASYNFVKDISDTEYVEKLRTLDLEANEIADLRQLSYISPNLQSITLAGNKVSDNPKYVATLLEFGKGLETVDEVPVASIRSSEKNGAEYSISSPKRKATARQEDSELIARLKRLGLAEDLIRESIVAADSLLGSEPPEDEILRQSIKAQGVKGENKGKLKAMATSEGREGGGNRPIMVRPATASSAAELGRRKKAGHLDEVEEGEDEPRVEGYSELVTTTEEVFAGNPLKAAKIKKQKCSENLQRMDIYSLIDQFKDASANLKSQISRKLGPTVTAATAAATITGREEQPVPVIQAKDVVLAHGNVRVLPATKGPIRVRGMISIKKIKHIKM